MDKLRDSKGRNLLTVPALETLIDLFRRVSGLKANHCSIRSDYSLEFDGVRPDGSKFHIESLPAPGHLADETVRLAVLAKHSILESLDLEINYGEQMSKAQTIADRIKAARAKLNSDLDVIAGQLDAHEAQESEVIGRASERVGELKSEVDSLDGELRQLSNL